MSVASGSDGPRLFRHGHIKLGIGLGYVIRLNSWGKCLDPRDKIDGVLGFLKVEEKNPFPGELQPFKTEKAQDACHPHQKNLQWLSPSLA